MFSKIEAVQLRKEFWTTFGKAFPRKWLLYKTKIKGIAFKFQADRKNASVSLFIEHPQENYNELLFNKIISLKLLLETELPDVIYDANYKLDNGKEIKRIYIPFKKKFSIYNKNTWRDCFEFFVEKMTLFETFFYKYEDFIRQSIP